MSIGGSLEVRLRAVEFLLAHLISKTKTSEDLDADRLALKKISEDGLAWQLMPEIAPLEAKEVVEAAVELLEDALFQMGQR